MNTVVSYSNASIALRTSFTGLVKGQRYYARVRAYTIVGYGNYSSVSGPQMAVDVPAPPSITSLSVGSTSGLYYFVVNWNAPTDTGDFTSTRIPITSYSVELSNSSSFPAALLFSAQVFSTAGQSSATFNTQTGTSAMSSFVQKGLGTVFYFRVRATSIMGTSNNSDTANRSIANTPSSPASLRVSLSGPLSLLVSWAPPTNLGAGVGVPYPLLQYAVTLQPAGSYATYVVYAPASASQVVVSDWQGAPLVRGQGYYVTVQAQSDVGLGALYLPQQYIVAAGLSTAPTGVTLCPSFVNSMCSGYPSAAGPLSLRCSRVEVAMLSGRHV